MNVLAVLTFCVAIVSGAPGGRILNGINTSPGQYPFMVSITNDNEHACGGFIYNERFVVTSASCIQQKLVGSVAVVIGQYSLIAADPDEAVVDIRNITLNPDYDNVTQYNNIAVIELSRAVVYGPVVANIIVDDYLVSNNATIIGWGGTYDGDFAAVKMLRSDIPIIAGPVCGNYSDYSRNFQICAGDLTHGSCNGDEGGPLTQGYGVGIRVVGLFSFSKGCESGPGIYTRIFRDFAWLSSIAGQQ